jgi:Ran GTPase-activating protein (RanGAP) involved in mRNA processing and transport
LFTPVSNYLKQLILPLIRIFYPYYKMTEAEKARAVEKEKTLNVDTLKLEISRLETEVANDNGPELEFYHLRGKTIDVQVKQYTYTHKPFDTVEQKENNGGSTSLG